jgi:hypothetical protein
MAIERLGLRADADRLSAWLGDHELPVSVHPGPPGIDRVVLAGPTGEIEIPAG